MPAPGRRPHCRHGPRRRGTARPRVRHCRRAGIGQLREQDHSRHPHRRDRCDRDRCHACHACRSRCHACHARLSRCHVCHARLSRCHVCHARLSRCHVRHARLSRCQVCHARLSRQCDHRRVRHTGQGRIDPRHTGRRCLRCVHRR
ncbi:pentapeptide repeat-containing protein [Parenemella sanctibonifatiensis]|uniref:pentapeptide repeat-containing protein n=1 Tax=Parenemella sanctibonifatiensis TaxID=2016505 RepID=UPI00398369AB